MRDERAAAAGVRFLDTTHAFLQPRFAVGRRTWTLWGGPTRFCALVREGRGGDGCWRNVGSWYLPLPAMRGWCASERLLPSMRVVLRPLQRRLPPRPLRAPDRQLQRLKREFNDPSSRANSSRLASDLNDISNIMRRNVNEVLDRGEKLESASEVGPCGTRSALSASFRVLSARR